MNQEMNGKVAVISGAGGALGTAVARRLHRDGVRLALIDRNEEALERVVGQLTEGSEVLTAAVDITQVEETRNFVTMVAHTFGGIDILTNIAGGFVYSGPVHDMELDQIDEMFDVNARTAFVLSSLVAKEMVAGKRAGRIVNVSARAAVQGAPGMAAYSASKAAVLRLTECMAMELMEHHITVNAILPSIVDTPTNRRAMPEADVSRWVTPESLADVIAFLASDEAEHINGAAIPVYGKA